MKKIIALALILALTLFLFGCNGTMSSKDNDNNIEEVTEEVTEEELTY